MHKLTKPNGMTLTQSYEAQRDLLTGMAYHRGTTLVAQREYTYDVLSRPTARTTSPRTSVSSSAPPATSPPPTPTHPMAP